jgi:hypothetical protein
MNYRDARTIWPNGRMFHPGRIVCPAARTPELAATSQQARSVVIGSQAVACVDRTYLTCDTRGHREQARLADLGFRTLRGVKLRTKPRP